MEEKILAVLEEIRDIMKEQTAVLKTFQSAKPMDAEAMIEQGKKIAEAMLAKSGPRRQ